MINGHKKIITMAENHLIRLGFFLISSDKFKDIYGRQDGWKFLIYSEIYDDGVYFEIIPPYKSIGYNLGFLMSLYKEKILKREGLRDYEATFFFLDDNADWLFSIPQAYESRYNQANRGW